MPKISELPDATTVNDADEIVILQGGVVKRLTREDLNLPPSLRLNSGYYYTPLLGGTPATGVVANNLCTYLPIYIGKQSTFDRIALTTGPSFSGTSTVRLGIFNNDETTGKPSTLVLDAGTVSCSVANTLHAITINQTLSRNWYWLAAVTQGAATTNSYYRAQTGQYGTTMQWGTANIVSLTCGFSETVTGPFTTANVSALIQYPIHIGLRNL